MRGGSPAVEVDPTHNNLKVKPGLSSFASHPGDAGDSLEPLVDFIKAEVPEAAWTSTGIYLKATAGLRMVEEEAKEAILNSVRGTLRASGLRFEDPMARVISGLDEGGFGWMSVNYLMGNLDGDPRKNNAVAVVEMGGASAQVTQFAPKEPPAGYEFEFQFGERTIELYTHSYLGFGLEKAREQLSSSISGSPVADLSEDPCLNDGYQAKSEQARASVYDGPSGVEIRGSATAVACTVAVEKHLFGPALLKAKCDLVTCSFGGVYQPKRLTKEPMLAFENFFYTAKMLGIAADGVATPKDFADAAKEVCQLDWTELEAQYPKDGSDKSEITKLCFSATYLAEFLSKGLGVHDDQQIRVQQAVGEHGIDWSLGAAIHEAAILAAKY